MTLEQLRIFVEAAERGHMTRAAAALRLTQSAVSAAVSALEARHGVQLFDRVGRGVVLSRAGEAFLPEARAVLSRAAAAEGALDDLAGLRRGRVVVAASQTVASYWLPARMARFAQAHPAISLRLIVGNTAQVAALVEAGEADLGLVEGAVVTGVLERRRISSDRISLYAAPGHPLCGPALEPPDLRAAHWVLREPGSGTRAHFEAALTNAGLDPGDLAIRFEAPSNEACLAAIAAGGLVTVVSDLAAAPHLAGGQVARLAYELPTRAFDLLRHRERRPSRAVDAFTASLTR